MPFRQATPDDMTGGDHSPAVIASRGSEKRKSSTIQARGSIVLPASNPAQSLQGEAAQSQSLHVLHAMPINAVLDPESAAVAPGHDSQEMFDLKLITWIQQMMFVSGETAEPSAETTWMIEEVVREQVVEMVRS